MLSMRSCASDGVGAELWMYSQAMDRNSSLSMGVMLNAIKINFQIMVREAASPLFGCRHIA